MDGERSADVAREMVREKRRRVVGGRGGNKRRGRRGEDGEDDAGDDAGWKTSERGGPSA